MNAKNIFTGKMNLDVDYERINNENGDYLHAKNIRNGYNGIMGSVIPVKGFDQIENKYLPDGDNVCIGTIEDKYEQTVVIFIYNSLGNHSVFRYYPFRKSEKYPDGIFEPLIISSELNFTKSNLIHGTVVDGECLWTDAYASNVSIVGNSPRKINLPKFSWINKKIWYSFTNAEKYRGNWRFVVSEPFDNNTEYQATVDYTGEETMEAFIEWLQGRFVINSKFDFKDCGDHLEIAYKEPGYCVKVTKDDFPATLKWFALNYIPQTFNSQHIELIKRPPNVPLSYFWQQADEQEDQDKKPFQFIMRYLYSNGEKSAWTQPSRIILKGRNVADDNDFARIVIDFSFDDILFDEGWLHFIEGIEIAYRESNLSLYKSLISLTRYQIGPGYLTSSGGRSSWFIYESQGHESIVASDGSILSDTGQFLKLYDNVPRLVSSLGTISDENGNTSTILGGLLENYNVEVCPQVEITNISRQISESFKNAVPKSSPQNASKFLNHSHLILKNRGRYGFGIVYEDDFGRVSSVQKIGVYQIPESAKVFDDNVLGAKVYLFNRHAELNFTISSLPPTWAKYYRIVRTKNMHQELFAKLWVDQIAFKKIGENNSFDDNHQEDQEQDSDYIELTIPPIVNAEEPDDQAVKSFINSAQLPIDIAKGDMVRLIGERIQGNSGRCLYFDDKVKDYEIEICKTDVDGNLILLIRKDQEIDYGFEEGDIWFIEIYRPSSETGEIYYSSGNKFIIDNGFHSRKEAVKGGGYVQDQSQTASLPARITFFGGDTYMRSSDDLFSGLSSLARYNNGYFERMTFSDHLETKDEDIGSPNLYDPDFKQLYNKNWLRTSDIYIPNSGINGLSAFRELDYSQINIAFGAIKRIAVTHNIALVVCLYKSQPLYIAKNRLMDLSGNTLVGRTDNLVNIANELQNDLGTHHSESIVVEDGYVYGWDVFKGVLWRYASNGQFPISNYGMVNYFKWIGKERKCLDPFNEKVVGCYQREFMNAYFTFGVGNIDYQAADEKDITELYDTYKGKSGDYVIFINNGRRALYQWNGSFFVGVSLMVGDVVFYNDLFYVWSSTAELLLQDQGVNKSYKLKQAYSPITWAFEEGKDGFPCEMEFLPEMYGRVGLLMFGFKNGQMYRFESKENPRGYFFGKQYSPEITFVENTMAGIKLYNKNIRIDSDEKLYCSEIFIPANFQYKSGMLSSIPANKFVNYEGHWSADFLRDTLDTYKEFLSIEDESLRKISALLRGRYLRGEVLIVTLVPENIEKDFNLKSVDIEFNSSQNTKP